MDDNLVWYKTLEDNFKTVCRLLEIYGKAGPEVEKVVNPVILDDRKYL